MKYPKLTKPPDMSDKDWNKVLLFSLVSFVFLLMLICTSIYELNFILKSKSADGEVVALNAGRGHVKVEFRTIDGKLIRYSQSGLVIYNVGDKVTVLYDPERPNRFASTNAIGALWTGTISLLFFTVVFSLATAASLKSK